MALKYKVGDRVRIKSLDWYNKNKKRCGEIPLFKSSGLFVPDMSRYCNNIMTIKDICYGTCYRMKEDFWNYNWTDEMIEGFVEEKSSIDLTIKGEEVKERIEITIPEGYEYVIESGKIIFTKKEKEYPKTFLECCDVLGIGNLIARGVKGYKAELFDTLQKLYICRDAYWKIAGKEMGLGKPWEPDCDYNSPSRYIISCYFGDIIKEKYCGQYNRPLSFPTEEMRNAFYENFKEEIEICKELL